LIRDTSSGSSRGSDGNGRSSTTDIKQPRIALAAGGTILQ
jgi:hypothetical protein